MGRRRPHGRSRKEEIPLNDDWFEVSSGPWMDGASAPHWEGSDLEDAPQPVLLDHALDRLSIDAGFPGSPAHMAFVALEEV